MAKCKDCKWAEWQLTPTGRIRRNSYGECKAPEAFSKIYLCSIPVVQQRHAIWHEDVGRCDGFAQKEGGEGPMSKVVEELREGLAGCREQGHCTMLLSTMQVGELLAHIDRLEGALGTPDEITAEPSGDYNSLRKQFLALRSLANSKCRMSAYWRKQTDAESREMLLARNEMVSAERDTNTILTDALERAEARIEELEADLKQREKHYSELAAHHNDACSCLEIY